MFNKKFLEELFKPQELYSKKALRTVFDRLAHASIMRLNQASMDKVSRHVYRCSPPVQLSFFILILIFTSVLKVFHTLSYTPYTAIYGSLCCLKYNNSIHFILLDESVESCTSPSSQLYDLMTMAFKYQVLLCPRPKDILLVSFNHMDAIKDFVKDTPSILSQVDETYQQLIEVWHIPSLASCMYRNG